jgi:tetratricopeptide (TPR) repeat protein
MKDNFNPVFPPALGNDPISQELAQAEILKRNFQLKEAIIIFTNVINKAPNNTLLVRALSFRGYCYRHNYDIPSALKDINAAIQIEPTNTEFWFEKIILHGRLMEFEEGINAANKALELEMGHRLLVDVLYQRGWANYKLGSYEESIRDYEKCLEKDSTNYSAREGLNLSKLARDYHFIPTVTKNVNDAMQTLVNQALEIIPIQKIEIIRKAFNRVQSNWGSKRLITGNIEEIQTIILKNLNIYVSRNDFSTLKISIDLEVGCALISAEFKTSFIGIDVWRSKEYYCVCGNSNFTD